MTWGRPVTHGTYELNVMTGMADFSGEDEPVYRYRLIRRWDEARPIVNFICLNPSTADALTDDPTVRRCVRFARSWGFGQLVLTNLFALRATDPSELCLTQRDPVGLENDKFLRIAAHNAELVVAAWGGIDNLYRNNVGFALKRALRVYRMLDRSVSVLGLTKPPGSQPRHPLYMRADTQPIPWMWLEVASFEESPP